MYLPDHRLINKNRSYINVFGGYNHNPVISDAEFYDMQNMTADKYPVLSSREARNYKLRVATAEYEYADVSVKTEFVKESLSVSYAIYTITIPVKAEGMYGLNFEINENYVEKWDAQTFRCCKNGRINTAVYAGKNMKEIWAFKGDTHVEIKMTVWKKAGVENWTEENAGLFVQDIRGYKYNATIRGMLLKNGKLAYLIKNKLYWNGQEFDFSDYAKEGKQQLISFGAYILIFPMGVYLNTQDTTDYGYLGNKCSAAVTYSACDLNGAEYQYVLAEKAPENPEDGKYWMKKSSEGDALYRWSETMAMWTAVSTTYIKIQAENDVFKGFDVGDAVHIKNASVDGIDGVNTISSMGTIEEGETTKGYIVITGIIRETTSQTEKVEFERKIPILDYVCVSNNRVWGCHYGEAEDGVVNEIYACKLGDPKNWYSYVGTSMDSYALSLGEDGEFTGAYTYKGYPLFFKENNVYKIYGNYPAAYQLVTYDCRGVQKGSSKSITVVDEYLVYKSINDVCVFDGNYPVSLSQKLGMERYSECAAGAYMGKYYASMKDRNGEFWIFVYDFRTNLWVKDEKLHIEEFISTKSGELYGRTDVAIISFGNKNDALGLLEIPREEETVSWFAELGTYGLDSPDKKFVKEIKIRAAVYPGAKLKVEVYYDDKNKWNEYWVEKAGINGDGKIKTYKVPIIPVNCDTMKIKLSGIGKVEIYSLAKDVEDGK